MREESLSVDEYSTKMGSIVTWPFGNGTGLHIDFNTLVGIVISKSN